MPLDQLLAALEREAGRTAEHLLDAARAEADQLAGSTERAIAGRRDTAAGVTMSQQRAVLERAVSDAARAARRDTLIARERLLARVFDAVRAALPDAIAKPSYHASLPTRVAAALACFDEREAAVLHCPASLVAVLQSIVAGRATVTVQEGLAGGSGFRLATTDGTIEVDDTLESRLETTRPSLARKALRQLVPTS
jgi:vacuolar-type H+-ATPase subunit E/Vma4